MSLRIKAVVDRFVQELKEALDADIQDRIMKEREMQSYIEEREREVAEREAAWKAELSRREVPSSFSPPSPFCLGTISFIVEGKLGHLFFRSGHFEDFVSSVLCPLNSLFLLCKAVF